MFFRRSWNSDWLFAPYLTQNLRFTFFATHVFVLFYDLWPLRSPINFRGSPAYLFFLPIFGKILPKTGILKKSDYFLPKMLFGKIQKKKKENPKSENQNPTQIVRSIRVGEFNSQRQPKTRLNTCGPWKCKFSRLRRKIIINIMLQIL